jgi:hypothetical protein
MRNEVVPRLAAAYGVDVAELAETVATQLRGQAEDMLGIAASLDGMVEGRQ